ncbi:Oxysterol-binding protein-related protein 10 [Myotis brandtii]|uniref:Oxysterol-binding protein-related protein 10 n=1 Tax=Myotis brandtii TaxID=109478 RepID=S7NBR2_MYOBR|nr:Oxysterol-binding protein-related protein 10 [Myotis brandtii]
MGCKHSAVVRTHSSASSCLSPLWEDTDRGSCQLSHPWSAKTTPSSRSRSLTLLPHGTPNSASPCSQRHLGVGAPGVVTVTHHKSPAAARRAKSQYSGQLHEVREVMNQVEGQQKNLVHAIESLPGSGPLTALDQDLLLLKATSAATLSCLGECFNLLQQSVHQVGQSSHKPVASENILGWPGPKSHSTEQLKNGTFGSLPSASANITWAILPNTAEDEQALQPELPWVNSEPTNEASPLFIETGVILTSSGRTSHTPIKMMPGDMMGAVTIYSVTPPDNGFFVWFVLKILPHMLDSRMLQTQARVHGAAAEPPSRRGTAARVQAAGDPALPGQEEQPLQI